MEKTMDLLVADFTEHLSVAIEIADKFKLDAVPEFNNVLICGLGGSGIGGTILSQLLADHCSVPVQSSKDYTIPAFVDGKTLVIACSYSGNTEETLEAIDHAIEQGANIACISSGGKLSDMAVQNNWLLITVPGGLPPRAAFGLTIVQLLKLAEAYGMTSPKWKSQVEKAIAYLNSNEQSIRATARQLAESIQSKLPIVYTSNWLEGVATRWNQQISENSKGLSWHNVYPEMNHNELVGWASGTHDLSVIYLTSSFDHPRVSKRMELTETVIRKKTPHIHHYSAKGDSKIEQALYLIHLGDWMTVYLA
ncbi:bifunctional phosphoglucose/phosphomannose isomerase, partial [Salibacteraceae bacterium]|nr:bifunctional phosphoglucose/phosphomannose isomerase [Salibacteraceae bacterium]